MKEYGNNSVKVRDILLEMRKQRMGLIQTPDQLRFSYLAIIEGSKTDWDSINDVSTIVIAKQYLYVCVHMRAWRIR